MCVNMYTYCPQYRDAGKAKEYKIGTVVNVACQEISPRATVSPDLV